MLATIEEAAIRRHIDGAWVQTPASAGPDSVPTTEFLRDWLWDPVLREMRHYPRRGKKGHAGEPDAIERLESAQSVRLHRWSQQPMQTSTGEVMPARQARVVVQYADGRKLEINDRPGMRGKCLDHSRGPG
jgi:hypothetical protein